MQLTFSKLKILLSFLLLFQNQLLIGEENSQFEQVRYYVAIQNIETCENGILIRSGESLILVKSLFHDQQGFYLFNTEDTGWICNWCGTINPLDQSTCRRCEQSYGSSPNKKKEIALGHKKFSED